jgi:uncharacterized membrane protein
LLCVLSWLVLMLDAACFHWSQILVWLQVVGDPSAGFFHFFLNTFKNLIRYHVRVQTERGQTVISTGPYRYVRHPMYATFIIFMVGTTLLLGSWYGLLLGLTLVIGIAFRAQDNACRAEPPDMIGIWQRSSIASSRMSGRSGDTAPEPKGSASATFARRCLDAALCKE